MPIDFRYFKLTSPTTRIPLTKNLYNVNKIQICYLNYKTVSDGNSEMKIFINNPNLNLYDYDIGTTNNRIEKLFTVFPLPNASGQQLPFKNMYPWYDIVLQQEIKTLSEIEITIKIDDVLSNDISLTNPLRIGFRFE